MPATREPRSRATSAEPYALPAMATSSPWPPVPFLSLAAPQATLQASPESPSALTSSSSSLSPYTWPQTPLPIPSDLLPDLPAPTTLSELLTAHITNLHSSKQGKAILTADLFTLVRDILEAYPSDAPPRDVTSEPLPGTTQLRFWARKMFALLPVPLDHPIHQLPAEYTADGLVVTHHNGLPLAPAAYLWWILSTAHAATLHGGRDKTVKEVGRWWAGVPKEVVAGFIKACPGCGEKRPLTKHSYVQTQARASSGEKKVNIEVNGDDEYVQASYVKPKNVPARRGPARNHLNLSIVPNTINPLMVAAPYPTPALSPSSHPVCFAPPGAQPFPVYYDASHFASPGAPPFPVYYDPLTLPVAPYSMRYTASPSFSAASTGWDGGSSAYPTPQPSPMIAGLQLGSTLEFPPAMPRSATSYDRMLNELQLVLPSPATSPHPFEVDLQFEGDSDEHHQHAHCVQFRPIDERAWRQVASSDAGQQIEQHEGVPGIDPALCERAPVLGLVGIESDSRHPAPSMGREQRAITPDTMRKVPSGPRPSLDRILSLQQGPQRSASYPRVPDGGNAHATASWRERLLLSGSRRSSMNQVPQGYNHIQNGEGGYNQQGGVLWHDVAEGRRNPASNEHGGGVGGGGGGVNPAPFQCNGGRPPSIIVTGS